MPKRLTDEERDRGRKEKKAEHAKRYRDKNKEKIAAYGRLWAARRGVKARPPKLSDEELAARRRERNRLRALRRYHEDAAYRASENERNKARYRAAAALRPKRVKVEKPAKVKVVRAAKPKPTVLPAVGTVLPRVLMGNALYAEAFKAVPRALPVYARDDIISEIVLAVLEGRLAEADIAKQAKSHVTSYWREYSHYTTVSLDKPNQYGVPLVERITYEDGGQNWT